MNCLYLQMWNHKVSVYIYHYSPLIVMLVSLLSPSLVCCEGTAKPLQQEGVYVNTTVGQRQKQGAIAQ